MWDKALAVWMLSGIGVAAMAVFPQRILAVATKRTITRSVLGFALGVFPLLVFNLENQWQTFRGNISRDTSDIPGKARLLMETAKGDGLFGWMFEEQWQTPAPRAPRGPIQEASVRISSLAGHPRIHGLFYAFLLAMLLTPLARGDALRAILFAVVAMGVAWLEMATNANTGGGIHHTILLWPFPQLVIAVSFAAASRRLGSAGIPALAVVTAVMVVSGVLVTNEYYFVSFSYGASPVWTDAIIPLSGLLKNVHAGNVYCVDWGILDGLRYLSHGKLAVQSGSDPIRKPELSPADREPVLHMVTDPGAIFVAHTKDFENFQGTDEKLTKFAAAEGYRRDMVAVIADSFGRPAFEVYRFAPAHSVAAQ
jgi:hypothetical protein